MSDTSREPASVPQNENPLAKKVSPTYVVGIGASAGGLEALEKFFDNMPADSGMAFVVVQHLSPDFKSLMDELLARHTSMDIYRVSDGLEIHANGIYLIPPKKNMILSKGKLLLSDQDSSGGLNLPIDIFFRSLAQDCGDRAIAVVLSGTGSDGSRGIIDVRDAGGLVLAQDIESAGFDGMPRNAVGTGMVNATADSESLPACIANYVSDPEKFARDDAELQEEVEPGNEINTIFQMFRLRHGLDFNMYRDGTMKRRIERRMELIRCRRLVDYVDILRSDSAEFENLYRDLLVEVTQFFRDPPAFDRIARDVVPKIVGKVKGAHDEIRVWVCGCATGEEAYSLAMLFDEALRKLDRVPLVKIFATDVHRSSLEAASAGVYSPSAMQNVPENFRKRYFNSHGSLYHVNSTLRQMVIFAPHNLANDPPFTRIDLISCRNVLIYLKPEIQKKVLSLFHFGLSVGGTLFLGPSESVGDLAREFAKTDPHWRIFEKIRNVRLRETGSLTYAPALSHVVTRPNRLRKVEETEEDQFAESVVEELLERYVPPSFLVNNRFELVHSYGDARKVFTQPKGKPTLEVLKMVDGDLRIALSTALHRAVREKEKIVLQGVKIQVENETIPARVVVEPLQFQNKEEFFLLVCLEKISAGIAIRPEAEGEQFRPDDQSTQRIVDLERELEFKKETLQTTVEELESSNEELQSTNEELVASNEELQSTNEELHSVNEELYTVNAEHQRKINELTHLTEDMDNLIRSTDIGTIFLDHHLCIRRFTPSIKEAFNIIDQDVGRPINQFAYQFDNPNLLDDAQRVLQTGEAIETEVKTHDRSKVYLQRMRPYHKVDDQVGGLVITITEITGIATAKKREEEKRVLMERIIRDHQDFTYAVSHDLGSPLRQIRQAIELISDSESLSDPVNGPTALLNQINGRCDSLEDMLQCLLEYSRVNTRGGKMSETHCKLLVEKLVDEFEAEGRLNSNQVSIGQLPVLLADAEQLEQVFRNLLDNAIKYNDSDTPQVSFSVGADGDSWLISCKDNGIGIQPQHFRDIFVIFKRLKFKPDVPGRGFGLALCSRIIERHSGSIWVESDGVNGSTFYVRIPRSRA